MSGTLSGRGLAWLGRKPPKLPTRDGFAKGKPREFKSRRSPFFNTYFYKQQSYPKVKQPESKGEHRVHRGILLAVGENE